MKLYLDTADRASIERHLATGLFTGVTCNPVILRDAGLSSSTVKTFYDIAVGAGAKSVFIQVFGETTTALNDLALKYVELGPEIVIKVPATLEGATVCARLRDTAIPVLMTAVHDARQTVTAMAARASFVTPYLSEMYRSGRHGLDQVISMQRILTTSKSETQLLMAGLHDMSTLVSIAEVGVGHLTVTPKLADELFHETHTETMVDFFNSVAS